MAEFGTYSFKAESGTFGITELTGWADGDNAVTIAQVEDSFTAVSGAKGDVARIQSSNDLQEITMRFLQTSQTAKDLINLHILDRETGNGVLPLLFANSETGEIETFPKAWIVRMPDKVRGAGHNAYEFKFHATKRIPITG